MVTVKLGMLGTGSSVVGFDCPARPDVFTMSSELMHRPMSAFWNDSGESNN